MTEKEALQARIADLMRQAAERDHEMALQAAALAKQAAELSRQAAELARLRRIEAAAQEARACLEGRRPGFDPSYAASLLRSVLDPGEPGPALPIVRVGRNPRGGRRRRDQDPSP